MFYCTPSPGPSWPACEPNFFHLFSILADVYYPFALTVFSKEGVFQQPRDLSSTGDNFGVAPNRDLAIFEVGSSSSEVCLGVGGSLYLTLVAIISLPRQFLQERIRQLK
jgi:hypothetical protein